MGRSLRGRPFLLLAKYASRIGAQIGVRAGPRCLPSSCTTKAGVGKPGGRWGPAPTGVIAPKTCLQSLSLMPIWQAPVACPGRVLPTSGCANRAGNEGDPLRCALRVWVVDEQG